jgi:hypothetical protein
MTVRQPRYSRQEHAQRGKAMYEQHIRPIVETGNHGKIVALDVDSGEFEIAANTIAAAEKLLARRPEAQIWFVRIGHAGVHHFATIGMSA